jgi:outer membrane protein assembly factor BamD
MVATQTQSILNNFIVFTFCSMIALPIIREGFFLITLAFRVYYLPFLLQIKIFFQIINGSLFAISYFEGIFDINPLVLQLFMKFNKVFITAVVFLLVLSSCNNKFNKVMKSKDTDYQLKMADQYFEAKQYRNAQQLYEELYPVYKGTPKFEELYYKDAYCFFYMKNYRDAENFFKGFLEVFPNSPKAEEVDFMHALCFYKQSPKLELEQVNTAKSVGVMQTFINTHPGSSRIAEATEIIDKCRAKLEIKELRGADLYYKVGQYRAAAISYNTLLDNYPESPSADMYKLQAIKSFYKFASLSYTDKQIERFEKVVAEYDDFSDRFPESKYIKEAQEYSNLSKNNIKAIQNEQTKTTTQL